MSGRISCRNLRFVSVCLILSTAPTTNLLLCLVPTFLHTPVSLSCRSVDTETQVRRSLSRLLSGGTAIDTMNQDKRSAPLAVFDADGTLWEGDAAEVFIDWMKASKRWGHHGDFVEK